MGTTLFGGISRTFATVHPHGRGDNSIAGPNSSFAAGSPPRAWGQLDRRYGPDQVRRFTPTGVGTTRNARPGRPTTSVHPHGRGDNSTYSQFEASYDGSPPRAWGQLRLIDVANRLQRFTPTGVGTTTRPSLYSPTNTVHPHGRGDNVVLPSTLINTYGSPPRAWGQRPGCCWRKRSPRFTPTGVGTTHIGCPSLSVKPVHPHGRGDNRLVGGGRTGKIGSPPRAWGQLLMRYTASCAPRFTPTGVGTTTCCSRSSARSSVHPHGRGDNNPSCVRTSSTSGSPPRAWGQRRIAGVVDNAARFTPTGVGTTSMMCACWNMPSVHPHGRGDNRRWVDEYGIIAGSPPRAWGQPIVWFVHDGSIRFTPTGVGTT